MQCFLEVVTVVSERHCLILGSIRRNLNFNSQLKDKD